MKARLRNSGDAVQHFPDPVSLIQGLLATGRFDEGISLIDETIRLVEANGDLVFMPELLRVKGNALLSLPKSALDEAERCFGNSLECLNGAVVKARWHGNCEQPSTSQSFQPNKNGMAMPSRFYNRCSSGSSRIRKLQI
jgi:hypothetical protein